MTAWPRLVTILVVSMGTITAASPSAAATAFDAADRAFVDKALALNTKSISRADVVEGSADNYVLDYAEQITGDRQAANTELAGIATAHGYRSSSPVRPTLGKPATARPAAKNDLNNARQLAGPYTPVAYFAGEVKANRQAVALYQAESENGTNASLRSYAHKFLPKMRGELATAQHLLHVEMSLHE